MTTKKSTPKKAATASGNDLEKDAVSASEGAWFRAWFKSAAIYLGAVTAYLGVATGLVMAWKKYFATEGEKTHLTIYLLAGILALPLLFALIFNLLPALRRRRERNLRPTGAGDSGYFTTAPREDDPHGFFAKGYDHFVEWAAKPPAPLLHLTGLSGSGKSSLLAACIEPRLAAGVGEEKTRTSVLILRSYTDPLAALKVALLPLWKKQPEDYDTLSPLDALRRAARQLGTTERLLVAFDQFEEFFLLRAAVPAGSTAVAGSVSPAAPLVADADLAPLHDFLHDFLAAPPEGVALLLSYRWDHQGLLTPLALPARTDGLNHRTVEPLDFATAAAFIRRCPGLSVPEVRMDRVLREAARQEGGRVVMRPIVANLLGLILQRMAGHPTLWRRSDDLLRGYLTENIGREVIEERGPILRTLLTDFHTARPRPIASLVGETKLDPAVLTGHLEALGHAGLLRCVNATEGAPDRRTWQIAHDFLAILIERVLDGVHRTLWRTVRPWLAPAAVVLAIGVGVVWPWLGKREAVAALANAGFVWNEKKQEILAATGAAREMSSLLSLISHIRRLQPRSLSLADCSALSNVDTLRGLTCLQVLSLDNCRALQTVDGLERLTSLQTLQLSGCSALQNVDGLKGLNSLKSLNLSNCSALQNVDGLSGLIVLQDLNLGYCGALRNVAALKRLSSLQSVDLTDCTVLRNVNVLKWLTGLQKLGLSGSALQENANLLTGLTGLKTLYVSGSTTLQNLDFLRELTGLQTVQVTDTHKLENLDGLKGLTGLQTLRLGDCTALQNLDGLKGLAALQTLHLYGCSILLNADILSNKKNLQTLTLLHCRNLLNVDGLKMLTSLNSLNLSNCSALQNVTGLKGLTSLQTLDLRNCSALQCLDGINGLTDLKTLDLSNNPALLNVDGLKGLFKLRSLNLSDCHNLQNVDGLKSLIGLQSLDLRHCGNLKNVDGLTGLIELRSLDLSDCGELQNVGALKGLFGLQTLSLSACHKISASDLGELIAQLNARVFFPDGPSPPR